MFCFFRWGNNRHIVRSEAAGGAHLAEAEELTHEKETALREQRPAWGGEKGGGLRGSFMQPVRLLSPSPHIYDFLMSEGFTVVKSYERN